MSLPTATVGEDLHVPRRPGASVQSPCWAGPTTSLRDGSPGGAGALLETKMRFGMHLRELSRLRIGVAVSLVVALLAAVWSVERVSLLPPKLAPRSVQTATAYTQVLIDTPKSALLNLGVDSDGVAAMTTRALLIGTLAASPPVESFISRASGVPVSELQIQAPSNPAHPAPRTATGRSNSPVDLVRSPVQYRLDIYADPIVPFLDIYAQAPTAQTAAKLANGAVDGLNDYIRSVAASQGTKPYGQASLRQFGRAQGKVINPSVDLQAALLVFLFVFGFGCVVTVALGRVVRGWRVAAASVGV